MRFLYICVSSLILLAACTGPQSLGQSTVTNFTASGRPLGSGPEYIDIVATYQSSVHQVDRIELVAPDGGRYEAPHLETVVEQNDRYGSQYGSVGVFGGSGGFSHAGVGLSLGFPLGGGGGGVPTVQAKGTVALPDAAAYRREWQKWHIVVTLSRGGTEPQEYSAPAPAPLR